MSVENDNLLIKSLFMTLQCVEFIAMLRVQSIVYLSVILPSRWLTGHAGNLTEYNFSAIDMGRVVDLLEDAMEEVAINGEQLLEEDFSMNIFSDIANDIPPFHEYLAYIFEGKTSHNIGGYTKLELCHLTWYVTSAFILIARRSGNQMSSVRT